MVQIQTFRLKNYVGIVFSLLKNGADVNYQNYANNTALNIAATEGHIKVVLMLVARDADINHRGYKGKSPLATAAAKKLSTP